MLARGKMFSNKYSAREIMVESMLSNQELRQEILWWRKVKASCDKTGRQLFASIFARGFTRFAWDLCVHPGVPFHV